MEGVDGYNGDVGRKMRFERFDFGRFARCLAADYRTKFGS